MAKKNINKKNAIFIYIFIAAGKPIIKNNYYYKKLYYYNKIIIFY